MPKLPSQKKYDALIHILRENPKIFASLFSDLIFAKNAASCVQKDQNLLASLLVFSIYGNIANQKDERNLMAFLEECIQTACEKYDKAADILQNAFIKKILLNFTRQAPPPPPACCCRVENVLIFLPKKNKQTKQ